MAYTWAGGTMNLTHNFAVDDGGVVSGPRCRAAMLQHETGHWIGLADHSYEWAYDALTVDRAVENIPSYVAFVRHPAERRDVRHDPDDVTN